MPTLVAFLLGVITGWFIGLLFAPTPTERGSYGQILEPPTFWPRELRSRFAIFFGVLAFTAVIFYAAQYSLVQPERWAANLGLLIPGILVVASGILAFGRSWRLSLGLLVSALGLEVAILYGTDSAVDWPWVLWISEPGRIAAAGGIFVGIFAGANHSSVAERAGQVFDAIFKSESASPLFLQIGFGLLFVVLVVTVANPGLWEHLTELHAGQISAKFSEVSSATRETVHVSISDLTGKNTIDGWRKFGPTFEGEHPHCIAEHLDDLSQCADLKKRHIKITQGELERINILKVLFSYFDHLTAHVSCLQDQDRDLDIRYNPRFIKFASDLRSLILSENRNSNIFNEDRWKDLLIGVSSTVVDMHNRIPNWNLNNRLCQDLVPKQYYEANKAKDASNQEATETQAKEFQVPKFIEDDANHMAFKTIESEPVGPPLSWLDPYVAAFEGDLLALIYDQTEKADFLASIEENINKKLTPGLVNFYYTLADSMHRSGAHWPFIEQIKRLNTARSLAERYIDKGKNIDDKELGRILSIDYMKSSIIFDNLFFEIVCLRRLSGEKIDPEIHREWSQIYNFTEAVLRLKDKGAATKIGEGTPATFNNDDKSMWSEAYDNLDASYRFDTFVGMALSAVLLNIEGNHASPLACETAWFYLSKGTDQLDELYKSERSDSSDIMRLHGYTAQIKAAIDASCVRL